MRVVVLSIAALAVLAACGGNGAAPREEATPPPAGERDGPADEPPVTEEGGPPPAWIETPDERAWMAYGSYAWDGITFDVLRATCDDDAVPSLAVRRGDTVRFHLPFEPREAELSVGAGDGTVEETVEFEPAETLEWEADREGHLWLSLPAGGGRLVAYQACLRLGEA